LVWPKEKSSLIIWQFKHNSSNRLFDILLSLVVIVFNILRIRDHHHRVLRAIDVGRKAEENEIHLEKIYRSLKYSGMMGNEVVLTLVFGIGLSQMAQQKRGISAFP
jgi:hypothetical protein